METFYSEKGRQFPDEFFFLSSCFSFQTRADLVLVKFYYDGAFRHFLKTFRKFTGKRLWSKPFLGKFKLFKMGSGKGVFLSVFRTPFYGCFLTLKENAFPWMITLFGANTLESLKSLKTKNGSFFLLNTPISTSKLYVFFEKYSSQKNLWNLKGCFAKISPPTIS